MEPATKEQMEVLLHKFEAIAKEVRELKEINRPAFISCKEYARQTGLDVSSVARLCRAGKLKAKQVGVKWLINRKELEA